jgi:hypothetical protein
MRNQKNELIHQAKIVRKLSFIKKDPDLLSQTGVIEPGNDLLSQDLSSHYHWR